MENNSASTNSLQVNLQIAQSMIGNRANEVSLWCGRILIRGLGIESFSEVDFMSP